MASHWESLYTAHLESKIILNGKTVTQYNTLRIISLSSAVGMLQVSDKCGVMGNGVSAREGKPFGGCYDLVNRILSVNTNNVKSTSGIPIVAHT